MATFSKFMLKLINFFVGVLLIVSAIGAGALIGFHLNGDFQEVEATIVDTDGVNFLNEYKYFVKYSYDDKEYTPEWPITSFDELKEGDKIPAYVIGERLHHEKAPMGEMVPNLLNSVKLGVIMLLICTMLTTILNAFIRLITLNQKFPDNLLSNIKKVGFGLLGSMCTYALMIFLLKYCWDNQTLNIPIKELMPAIIGIIVLRVLFAFLSLGNLKTTRNYTQTVQEVQISNDSWDMPESNGLIEEPNDEDVLDQERNNDTFEL